VRNLRLRGKQISAERADRRVGKGAKRRAHQLTPVLMMAGTLRFAQPYALQRTAASPRQAKPMACANVRPDNGEAYPA